MWAVYFITRGTFLITRGYSGKSQDVRNFFSGHGTIGHLDFFVFSAPLCISIHHIVLMRLTWPTHRSQRHGWIGTCFFQPSVENGSCFLGLLVIFGFSLCAFRCASSCAPGSHCASLASRIASKGTAGSVHACWDHVENKEFWGLDVYLYVFLKKQSV